MFPAMVCLASVLLPAGPLTPIEAPASSDWNENAFGIAEFPYEVTTQAPYAVRSSEPEPKAPGATVIFVKLAPPASDRVVPPGIVTVPTVMGCVVTDVRIRLTPPNVNVPLEYQLSRSLVDILGLVSVHKRPLVATGIVTVLL